jgi:hypothetical protein
MQWRQDFSFSGLKITTYDFNIYISYFSFQIQIFFVWCRFSFKVIAYTRSIIKILNVMVFHFINLVLMYIWVQNNQLNVRLIILLISMSCFIFLGDLPICCLNCLYGSILCPMYILLLFSHLMLYTKCSCMRLKNYCMFCKYIAFLDNIICSWIFLVFLSKR